MKSILEPISTLQNTLPFQIAIFIESTTTPSVSTASRTIDTTLEVPTFESEKEENSTSNIPEHTSNVDSNVDIDVNILEPYSTSVPLDSSSADEDFVADDEPESLEGFSIMNSNFQVESDDEVVLYAPVTRGEFHELNKKIDKILLHTNLFSTTNW